MGWREQSRRKRVDGWLAQGGVVLAGSARAARSIATASHAARLAEGSRAWETPAIFGWDEWVGEQWRARNKAGLMPLNALQEQALWSRVIRNRPAVEGLQHLERLASSARLAYVLLAEFAPGSLQGSARLGWSGDAGIFSDWLADFESRCGREYLTGASRLPLLLADALQREGERRPALLLVGFDRLRPSQEALLDAWGDWRLDLHGEEAAVGETQHRDSAARFFAVADAAQEVEACVRWLEARLRANPAARLMVVTTNLQARRGELERALLAGSGLDASGLDRAGLNGCGGDGFGVDGPRLDFEFSLGLPLAAVGVVRSALLLLRWMAEPLAEPEVDWLVTSGHSAASADEELALAQAMLRLRMRGLERPEWPLDAFSQSEGPRIGPPAAWTARLDAARRLLELAPEWQTPLEWVELAQRLLEVAGWPGYRAESSVAYQARERWQAVLEECGSLGFDGSQMRWAEFVQALAGAVAATIFAVESSNAPIQITEPLPSAGQLADGIWFLGVQEEDWPGRGQPHPLLPVALQRQAAMPHASHQADWELAAEATRRLLSSADEVVFSYARHVDETEARPSRLVVQMVGAPEELPEELRRPARNGAAGLPMSEVFEDASRIRFPHAAIAGGAATLTRQSLCPFQAMATARLGICEWEPAEYGLNARQRGQLLHAVLHRVWGGAARGGISTLSELEEKTAYLQRFVRGIADAVIRESFGPGGRGAPAVRFPARLLELEAQRLTVLVCEWLAYERQRAPFTVAGVERETEVSIAGLTLSLRLDRVDQIADGGQLVIDYKSSDVGPSAWRGARPEDVQLPLYATFGVREKLEGLVIAQVRPGEAKFCGRVRNAGASLLPALSPRNGLVRDPLNEEQLDEWRRIIERLGEDFVAGKADVDPKNPVKTCERCSLHAVCRIYENRPLATVLAEDEDPGDAGDELNGGGGRDA